MNWTGGHLQRHSTITASTKDRQKQHFAKIRQNQCHQVQKICPIKFSFSCFDAEDRRTTPYSSLMINESHDALIYSDLSFNKSLQLSPIKLQAKRRQHIYGTEVLLGFNIKRENDGISNINLPYRIPAFNSEIKLSTCKSANKTLSERQNALDEPASKKQKILDMPDWIGIGMSKPSSVNCASSIRKNYNDCGYFYDVGQYGPNDIPIDLASKKDFSLTRNEDNYFISYNDSVSTTETVLEKKISQAIPRKASTHPDVIFASSTVCLKHPIPLSSKISCLIKAKSTNEMDKDNEIASLDLGYKQTNFLNKKLAPLSCNLNQKFYGHQKSLKSKNSSIQNISQEKNFRGCNYKIRSEEYDREPEVRNEGVSSVIQSESNLDSSSSFALPETRFTPGSGLELSCNRITKKVRLKGMQIYQPSNTCTPICREDLEAKRKDPDEVWKGFVFGAYLDDPTNSKIDCS